MREPIRLDKRVVEVIECSRGDAIKYIQGGWVLVDGKVVELPQFKVQDQSVALHEDATLEPIDPVTLVLHLPDDSANADSAEIKQLITLENHNEDDYSGVRVLNNHFFNLKPVAPLQKGATGLMIFSKDWKVQRVLEENNKKKEEEYIVEFSEEYTPEALEQLNELANNGDEPAKIKASKQNEIRMRFVLEFAHPTQIESLCERAGLKIVAMKRIRIGRVAMKKLPPGEWRFLSRKAMF